LIWVGFVAHAIRSLAVLFDLATRRGAEKEKEKKTSARVT
jgi:hypothetical protein